MPAATLVAFQGKFTPIEVPLLGVGFGLRAGQKMEIFPYSFCGVHVHGANSFTFFSNLPKIVAFVILVLFAKQIRIISGN